jgi:hypothetical protein
MADILQDLAIIPANEIAGFVFGAALVVGFANAPRWDGFVARQQRR